MKARMIEEVLSDGSKAYNVAISDGDTVIEMGALTWGHAVYLLEALESNTCDVEVQWD